MYSIYRSTAKIYINDLGALQNIVFVIISLIRWIQESRMSNKLRQYNSLAQQLNVLRWIPDYVFSFPGIFEDGYLVYSFPIGLADQRFGWIKFFGKYCMIGNLYLHQANFLRDIRKGEGKQSI